jgi:hypothetical protein
MFRDLPVSSIKIEGTCVPAMTAGITLLLAGPDGASAGFAHIRRCMATGSSSARSPRRHSTAVCGTALICDRGTCYQQAMTIYPLVCRLELTLRFLAVSSMPRSIEAAHEKTE